MMLTEFERQAARLLKSIIIAMEHPGCDKSDISALAARLKRMPNQNEAITPLVRACADAALLWSYFNSPDDERNLIDSATALLRALDANTRL
jgi:hypothetical protein